MLVSLIGGGMLLALLIFLIVGSFWFEENIWNGLRFNWRLLFPGYREAAVQKDIADKLKAYSDGQDEVIRVLNRLRDTRDKEHAVLYHAIYDDGGLEAQVKDLKQVLEWTRTHLNNAKQEVLNQMGEAHILRASLDIEREHRHNLELELRRRAIAIRQLGGVLPRKKRRNP